MSLSSSVVCVSGCRWPNRGRTPGIVGSNWLAPDLRRAFFRQPLDRRFQRGFDLLLDFVEAFAGGGLVGLVDRAEPLLHVLQTPAPCADELHPGGLYGRGIFDRLEGRRSLLEQFIQFSQILGEGHDRVQRIRGYRIQGFKTARKRRFTEILNPESLNP